MNDHGYCFYVHPWQGWVLQVGPPACLGAMLSLARWGQRRHGDSVLRAGPRWLKWAYFAGLVACMLYVCGRFP